MLSRLLRAPRSFARRRRDRYRLSIASVRASHDPKPGGEATVRRVSEELARGEPNYDPLSPQMADVTRQQLTALKDDLLPGSVQSVTFVEVGPSGGDLYEVRYANGGSRWIISLTSDGKLANAGLQPLASRP